MPEQRRVFDTVVLSNFLLSDSAEILAQRYKGRAAITWEVYDEITAGIVSRPMLATMETLVGKRQFEIIALSPREHQTYSKLLGRLGKGEASVIAVAQARHWIACSDDKAARRECVQSGVKFTGTIGILKAACMQGLLRRDQADLALRRMVENGFYSPVLRISDLL
jgi:predicted nucleic acid-binding protein